MDSLEYKPHSYWPDYQAMGDCVTCGHVREVCERHEAEWAVCQAIARMRFAPITITLDAEQKAALEQIAESARPVDGSKIFCRCKPTGKP